METMETVKGNVGTIDASANAMGKDPFVVAVSAAEVKPTTATDLFHRQMDQQKIEFLNDRLLHLQSENDTLRARHEKREQETHEFVGYFQKEIQTRDKQITKLTEELATTKLSCTLEVEAMLQAKESACQQLQQTFSSKEESYAQQVYFLKEELQQLELFKDMKETIQNKMRELESQLEKERADTKENIGALERKFLEEKARLQKEHEKKIEIVKQQAKEDARNGLDADTRKIVTDNRRMGEELRFQLQMTEELQKEKQHFESQAKKFYKELQISQAKEEEYAKQAQRQNREIKQLRANLKQLEKQMSESLAEVEREKHVEISNSGKELKELTLDIDGLRRLLRLKNKELRNLRRLSQTILDQRTDVEQFFLDALQHVKQEIEKERKQAHDLEVERYHMEVKRANGMKTGASSIKFPILSGSASITTTNNSSTVGTAAGQPRHFSEKVDLRQLTWVDRERVLRLVFAKINGMQSYADATPQQQPSYDSGYEEDSEELVADCRDEQEQMDSHHRKQRHYPNQSAVYLATESAHGDSTLKEGPGLGMSLNGHPMMMLPTAPVSKRNQKL